MPTARAAAGRARKRLTARELPRRRSPQTAPHAAGPSCT